MGFTAHQLKKAISRGNIWRKILVGLIFLISSEKLSCVTNVLDTILT